MVDQAKQPETKEELKETQNSNEQNFDPWEAAFNRDLREDDREFEF